MTLPSTAATQPRSARPLRTGLLLVAVTALAYLVLPSFAPSSVAGLETEFLLGVVTGIVVGLGMRSDSRIAPWLALTAFAAVAVRFVLIGGEPSSVLLVAAIIGLEVLAVVLLVRRLEAQRLERPQDVLQLLVVALCVGLAAGSVVGAIVHQEPGYTSFLYVGRTWATDAIFGVLCIAPAFATIRRPVNWTWRQAVEYAVVCLATAMITVAIFRFVTPEDPGLFGWPYLVLLGPMWIAVRLGVSAVTPVLALVCWFAVVSTLDGVGAFAHSSIAPKERLIAVQAFCVVLSMTVLMLAILRDSRQRSMNQLRESSRLLHEVVDGTDAMVFAKSFDGDDAQDGRYVMVNRAWEEQTGLTAEQTLGRSDQELFSAELASQYAQVDHQVLSGAEPLVAEEKGSSPDGEMRSYNSSKFPLLREDGTVWGVGGIATDTTDLIRALQRERYQGELLGAVFERSPTPAMRLQLTAEGAITTLDANTAMCALMAMPVGETQSCDLMAHIHPDDVAAGRAVIESARIWGGASEQRRIVRQREVRLIAADRRVVWALMSAAAVGNADIESSEIVVQFEDFTARRRAEEALSDQALRDAVTGLPNRRALRDRLETALLRIRRGGGSLVVLFCDLDHFKDVNDTQGHQAGDELLIEIARRMQDALRPEDTVARLGGDEFVALGEGIADTPSAVQMGMRVLERVNDPWMQGDQVYRPSMSIGIAVIDDPDVGADEVLRRADLAMYTAKENGRSRLEVYDPSVDERYRSAVAIQHDLRQAIDSGSLLLHYQPIVELVTGSIIGAEALVRLVGRDGSLISPTWFVPQAENSGLIIPMGAWVVREAARQLQSVGSSFGSARLSINVSPAQLRDEGFADFVLRQLEIADVEPSRLAVEVTETALLNEPSRSESELSQLSREGVGIYLDDFGTGYSSLSWLTQFPVDVVKIDRSFTDELGIDERKTAIVSALIQVSHDLGFSVVGEGVENSLQVDKLIELGCDRAQGFLFGMPAPVDEVPWLRGAGLS